jgi:surface protein
MATLTTNISNVSLTVSGNTTKTATISWTCPTVPAGSTITSCRLTGNASSFTTGNKGATLTINNTSVSSGSSFTINLGTGNNTTSVQASFKGNHKQTNTSVTLSNLVYTVEYTEPLPTYTVTFKDWDGSVLKTQSVESGSAATAPSNPSREGYDFTGWDKTFSNITSDLTVTAQYSIKTYEVRFYEDEIYIGSYINVLKTEIVEHGKSATAPEAPVKEGYIFIGWSNSFTNITSDLDIYALYEVGINDTLQIKEDGNWINISKVYKRISGNWVEQSNSNLNTLFDTNMKYNIAKPNPVAIYYSDNTLVFQDSDVLDTSHGDVMEIYTGWDVEEYTDWAELPWKPYCNKISGVVINTIVSPFSTRHWFHTNNNIYLKSLDLNNFDTSNVTDMGYMFDIYFIETLDLSNFNTSNVTNMRYMFNGCENLTSLNISSFDTSNVINMVCMFGGCVSLTSLDLSNFDTGNTTDMTEMFYNCRSLTSLDLSNFDTSNVADMRYMFYYCSSLTSLDLSNFDTGNVTNMHYMFYYCSSLTSLDLSNFDTGNVTNMRSMFNNCSSLTSLDVSSFNTSNVTNMEDMFYKCSKLTSLDLSNFDTSNVTSMNWMFPSCKSLTSLDVSNFNTGNVTDMGSMFSGCSALTSLDLSSFDMTNVTSTNNMFNGCTSLQTIYVKDETAKTKIEASTNFPTTATVIIGKPN